MQRPLNSIHKLQVKNFCPTVEIRERYMSLDSPKVETEKKIVHYRMKEAG